MKIIDLLNKIANREEVPKKIHIKNFQSDFIFNGYTYLSDEKKPQNIYWCLHSGALNYEVEILDEEDKDIPPIPDDELIILKQEKAIDMQKAIDYNFKVLQEKINQVVEEFNNHIKENK